MNRTTTVAVALIVAAGLTTMVYAVPGTAHTIVATAHFAWGHHVVYHNSYHSYPVPYPVFFRGGGFGGCGWAAASVAAKTYRCTVTATTTPSATRKKGWTKMHDDRHQRLWSSFNNA
jgi:hypothetical protein